MATGAGTPRRAWLGWIGLLAVVLVAVQAVRSAFVVARGEQQPALAHALWPSHPLPQSTLALASIGAAAREGEAPDAEALAQMRSVARTDPLNVQPLLVAATDRLAVGDQVKGEQLLKAALRREPRSTAAHFLLADLYVRQQRIADALVHVVVLGRRVRGGGTEAFAGALATYLRDPRTVAEVGPALQSDPALKRAVMQSLAQDPAPAAAPALRALTRRGDASTDWFRIAFERHLASGNVGEARAMLAAARVAGAGTTLTRWSAGEEASPLSWRFPAGADGVSEPVINGPLRLVFYGRGDVALAEHLLLLAPGRYRLAAQFAGAVPPGTFEWRMTCLQGPRQLAAMPVAAPSAGYMIDIPADCPAQRLALWGRTGEFPRTHSAELVRVSLAPVEGTP